MLEAEPEFRLQQAWAAVRVAHSGPRNTGIGDDELAISADEAGYQPTNPVGATYIYATANLRPSRFA